MKKIILILTFLMPVTLSAQLRLTLDECIDKARSYNRTLQNAALDIQSATESKKEAYSKYFPEISANVTAFQAFDKIIKADGLYPQELAALEQMNPALAGLAGQPYSLRELNGGYGATLSVMQPLYTGGQITIGNKLANIRKEISELQLHLKEREVIQKVTENFWQIAQLKYNLQTIETAEKQIEAVQQQVSNFVETGVTTSNALLRVKLRRQELSSDRVKVEQASHILCMLLAQQIGLGTENIDIVLPDNNDVVALPIHVDAGTAAIGREEYELAGKNIETSKLNIKMERGKNMPSLAIGVVGFHSGMGGLSESVKSNLHTTMTNAAALATLSIPISSWWGGSHAIRRNKIKLRQAENDYAEAREMLAIDAESSWSKLIEAYKQVEIYKVSVTEADENLRMATEEYNVGKQTISDYLDAETLSRQAHNALSSAIASYHICYADYIQKTK